MTEVNGVRGEFSVTLGGKDLVFVPSFRRISSLETAIGRSVVWLASDLAAGKGLTLSDIATVVHVMARDPKPSRDEIGEMIAQAGVAATMPILAKLLERIIYGGGGATEGNSPPEEGASAA